MKKKIGIYGGSFSPVHNGHVIAAQRFLKAFDLDCLLLMPVCIPPHKSALCEDSPGQRLDMLRLAVEDLPEYQSSVFVSDYEIQKQGKSYTVDTLEHFSNDDTALYLLCGTDMFFSLESWKNPARIFSLATIVCARRYDKDSIDEIRKYQQHYQRKYGAHIALLPGDPYPISSTEIRHLCRAREDIGKYVPEKVKNYIIVNNLYIGNSKKTDTM